MSSTSVVLSAQARSQPHSQSESGDGIDSGRDLAVEVLDGLTGLEALRAEWTALFDTAARDVSMSFAWTRAIAAHHAGPADRLRTIAVRRGRQLVAALPLIARGGRHAFRHVTPLAEEYNTHSDWLFGDATADVAEALVAGLAEPGIAWDRFRMSRVLAQHPLLPAIVEALQRRGLRWILRDESPSFVLRLPRDVDAYLASRSAKFRNHLRRVEKKLERRRLEVVVADAHTDRDGVDAAFAGMLAVERESWKHAERRAISSSPESTAFWREVCDDAWAAGRLHLQLLTVDGTPAAHNIGWIAGGTYTYLKTSFHRDFRADGAAPYLRAVLIADLIRRHVDWLDFPGEPYEWERQWTADQRAHVMLTVFSGTARSRVLEVLERLRQYRRVRPSRLTDSTTD